MTSKHTKSPWNIEMNNHHTGSIATVYGCTDGYADIWSESWVDTGMPKEERDANARLIAAAPELYEAVAAVIDATRDYLPPNGITKDEFISRVIAATDNTRMAEIMK
ncbi:MULTISPECIES: hypothetical protein [Stenotrophomonas]|uniref:hypothetical protein n=1 Tax=Stenotrophomonas TaxID=40323 RepID=UPI0027E4F7B4|nr:hypothetical protein [Stenotrophomonas sp. Sm0581]MDQ7305124.1 hypothetical protein [Stenotrophomonas sp. Sm0581]